MILGTVPQPGQILEYWFELLLLLCIGPETAVFFSIFVLSFCLLLVPGILDPYVSHFHLIVFVHFWSRLLVLTFFRTA